MFKNLLGTVVFASLALAFLFQGAAFAEELDVTKAARILRAVDDIRGTVDGEYRYGAGPYGNPYGYGYYGPDGRYHAGDPYANPYGYGYYGPDGRYHAGDPYGNSYGYGYYGPDGRYHLGGSVPQNGYWRRSPNMLVPFDGRFVYGPRGDMVMYPDGTVAPAQDYFLRRKCHSCGATGVCKFCEGRGMSIMETPCKFCNGTGYCQKCHGVGRM